MGGGGGVFLKCVEVFTRKKQVVFSGVAAFGKNAGEIRELVDFEQSGSLFRSFAFRPDAFDLFRRIVVVTLPVHDTFER